MVEERSSFEDVPNPQMEIIISFLSNDPNDLCALDATCKRMASLTGPFWKHLSIERFGMGEHHSVGADCCSGKDAWKKGKAWTSPERNLHFIFQIPPLRTKLIEFTTLAYHGNTVVGAAHYWEDAECQQNRTRPVVIRDARSLKQCAVLKHKSDCFIDPSVGGDPKRPVITLIKDGLCFSDGATFSVFQGMFYKRYTLSELFPQDKERFESVANQWVHSRMHGCQNHFVMYCVGKLYLFKFDSTLPLSENNEFLPVQSFEVTKNYYDSFSCRSMKWGSSDDLLPGTFVVSCHGKLSVWHFDDASSTMSHVQTLSTGDGYEYEYDDVAIGKRYIVANPNESNAIHLYDRRTECQIAKFGNDVDDDSSYRGFPLEMQVYGDLLVCKRDRESADVCVWQLQTQTLLATFPSPESTYITSMIAIQGDGYNCLITRLQGCAVETVFGFPESEEGFRKLRELARQHTILVEPSTISPHANDAHRGELQKFVQGVKRSWHEENSRPPSPRQFKKYCASMLEDILKQEAA